VVYFQIKSAFSSLLPFLNFVAYLKIDCVLVKSDLIGVHYSDRLVSFQKCLNYVWCGSFPSMYRDVEMTWPTKFH